MLNQLYLSNCGIGDIGASDIGETLKLNKALPILDLSANQIRDAGAGNLADALNYNRTITTLDLRNNPIGIKTVNAFTKIWKGNGILLAVYLDPKLNLTTEYSKRNKEGVLHGRGAQRL